MGMRIALWVISLSLMGVTVGIFAGFTFGYLEINARHFVGMIGFQMASLWVASFLN